jgi:hypothetical protein
MAVDAGLWEMSAKFHPWKCALLVFALSVWYQAWFPQFQVTGYKVKLAVLEAA